MPACNNGVGTRIGFPDVCMTPPLGVPIPYPNIGMNCMSAVFSPNIFVGYMPQLTNASITPMTLGDQAGTMHPLFMQMGGPTLGNLRVLINCIPAITLCTPTFGNLYNNPIGLVATPSITTTLYSDAAAETHVARRTPVEATQARALRDAVRGAHFGTEAGQRSPGDACVEARALEGGIGYVALRRMTSDVGARLFNAMRKSRPSAGLVIDLRDNPGGDLDAALDAASELVDRGTALARIDRGDGEVTVRARGSASFGGPLALLVGPRTGSAAEAFAGALSRAGRATLVGERTFGKACAQSAVRHEAGAMVYATVARVTLADGETFDEGLDPDVRCAEPEALDRAIAHLHEEARGPRGGRGPL